jgi:pimeloyl-ACP methyl ester carboxylesterase
MKYLCCFLCLLTTLLSDAQRKQDFFAFHQRIQAAPYAGKKIKLEVDLRMDQLDSTGKAGIWLRVDKKDRKIGFFRNTYNMPVLPEWKTFTIEGNVSKKDADVIILGGLFQGRGQFYFDNFRLSVYNHDKWEAVPIINAGFEDTVPTNSGWYLFHAQQNLPLTFSLANPVEGARSFWYDGKNNTTPVAYGNNPVAGRFAYVNGINIYYETYGQGEPLLLLHGNGQNIGEFEQQIDFFKDHYKVIAVDTRGQGKSSEDGTRYTYHLFARDMYELLNHLQLDSVNMLGWSDGGNTGLILAMQYPQKVKRLAVMGANIFINKEAIIPAVFKEIHARQKQLAKDTAVRSRNDLRLMNLLLEEPNMRFDDLAAIHCPVLIMAGENDLIKEQHTKGIAQHINGAQLVIFSKGSHYMPQENARLFNKTVLDFLKQ